MTPPLRPIPRLTVNGARRSARAIARTARPSINPREIGGILVYRRPS